MSLSAGTALSAGEDITVLHVDDDPDVLDITATFLQRADRRFEVVTETDPDAALDRLDGGVDCVVSDYQMPAMDGLAFLDAVRDEAPELPFVLFTGKGSEEIASDAISAGVTDYLQKRTGTDQYEILANRIANAVDRHRTAREHARVHAALETATEGIGILDSEGRYVYANGAYAALYGLSREELAGEHWDTVYPEDQVERFREEILPALEDEGEWTGRSRGERADGSTFVEQLSLTDLSDGGHVCVVRDITERKKREEELEESRERYQSLFENNPLVIWEEDFSGAIQTLEEISNGVDDVEAHLRDNPGEIDRLTADTEVIDVNRNALSYYGAPSKEALIDSLPDLFVGDTHEMLAGMWASFADGETRFRGESVARTLDGERRNEIVDVSVPEAYAEDYSRVYVSGTDITERKERERELERKNERLEEFTSVVSHDLRNPLNVASARLELASDECDSPHLVDVADAHRRMETLIEDLLTLAREGETVAEFEPVDLGKLLSGCWETLGREGAALAVETGTTVRADRDRLRQLLENLLTNALEHGGTDVTITVGDLADGFYVEDDGPGIPADERGDVFEAGYSTAREGNGFGLSIVARIAEAHGWSVAVTEGESGGARFEVTGVETVE
jgi:PAS domain S-box-containing protein